MVDNKMMIIYGFDENERKVLDKIVNENKLPKSKRVTKEHANMKLKDIILGSQFKSLNSNMPDEKVIVFNEFSEEQLESAITNIRFNFKQMPILAVVTENSIDWSFDYLVEHLMEEREWCRKQGM